MTTYIRSTSPTSATFCTPIDTAVYNLSEPERVDIEQLLADIIQRLGSKGIEAVFAEAVVLGHKLPDDLVRFLIQFRRSESAAAVLITGLAVDDIRIGPTPMHWSKQCDKNSTLREELYFVLLGSLLGDIFGWSTLQNGSLLQNVLPIQGEENQQSGHGSDMLLEWHTEDAFHPYRCDYLGLMAMRNPDQVPTTFASIKVVDLTDRQLQILAERRFFIRPDTEHLRRQQRDRASSSGKSRPKMCEIQDNPMPTAVLFGDLQHPYLCIDPFFMNAVPGDAEAAEVLSVITQQLEGRLADLVIGPGDVCIIDNYRAVHGRRAFKARYDGLDRWLKKFVVTRDLRKSRDMREDVTSQILI